MPNFRRVPSSLEQRQQMPPRSSQNSHRQVPAYNNAPPPPAPVAPQRRGAPPGRGAPSASELRSGSMAAQYSEEYAHKSVPSEQMRQRQPQQRQPQQRQPQQKQPQYQQPQTQQPMTISDKIPVGQAVIMLASRVNDIETIIKDTNGELFDGEFGGELGTRLNALEESFVNLKYEEMQKDVVLLKQQIKMVDQSCKTTREAVRPAVIDKNTKQIQELTAENALLKETVAAMQEQINSILKTAVVTADDESQEEAEFKIVEASTSECV